MEPSQTLTTTKRIDTLDILRGIALCGIVLTHYTISHLAGPRPVNFNQNYSDVLNRAILFINNNFIASEFNKIFELLFGLGFIIQSESFEKKYTDPRMLYIRRFVLLGIIGLFHQMLWIGDILVIYAPMAFCLLLLKKITNRWILIISIISLLNLPGICWNLIANYSILDQKTSFPQGYSAYSASYMSLIERGNLFELFYYNLKGIYGKLIYQIQSGRLSLTFGFFLLGAYIGKTKIYLENESTLRLKKKLNKYAGGITIFLFFVIHLIFKNHNLQVDSWDKTRLDFIVESFMISSANIFLSLFYLTGLAILLSTERWKRILKPFSSIGKTALTNYILQSVIALFLFHNVFNGIFLYSSPATKYYLALTVFLSQLLISKLWIQKFKYGPIEWLWRSGVFMKWQKFKKEKSIELSPIENPLSSL